MEKRIMAMEWRLPALITAIAIVIIIGHSSETPPSRSLSPWREVTTFMRAVSDDSDVHTIVVAWSDAASTIRLQGTSILCTLELADNGLTIVELTKSRPVPWIASKFWDLDRRGLFKDYKYPKVIEEFRAILVKGGLGP